MVTARIEVSPAVGEYIRGKYGDDNGVVRFPPDLDIYLLLHDLTRRRPDSAGVDRGNLEIALPDPRDSRRAGGKNPATYNYITPQGARILADRMRSMMWAEVHDFFDEQNHIYGMQFKESAYLFLCRYSIDSISEDALVKNYQRWRQKCRRQAVRNRKRRK
ncbi:MAG: hypothetical protein K2H03_07830 [Muribaculaceae bacterium]|nr:hypothetical protein [Muribaculaceae bacterium]